MKALLILTFSFLLAKSCSDFKDNDIKNTSCEYEFYSRGIYGKILVSNKLISIYNERNLLQPSSEKQISGTDWKRLSKLVSDLNVKAIATYKDPTQKRFYDGAAIAVFVLKNKNSEYKTMPFDHGDPPVELKELIDKINEIAAQ